MKSQKLFALTGVVRGAARVVYEDIGGTLAVELSPRGAGEYEAWLAARTGPLLRAPLGAAMTAHLPAGVKEVDCVFITDAGRIVASGGNGFSRAQMESAALRVQLTLAQSAQAQRTAQPPQPAPAQVEQLLPPDTADVPEEDALPVAKVTIPASKAADFPLEGLPDAWRKREREERALRMVRDASVDPQLRSEAAMSILSMANSLYHPVRADDAQVSYVEQNASVRKSVPINADRSVRPSMAHSGKPMQPAQRNGAYPPANPQRSRGSRGRTGRSR